MAKYKNSWYRPDQDTYGPEYYETSAKPKQYHGFLIYERIKGVQWDIVKNNICVTQMAGINGAKQFIDELKEDE